MTIRTRLVILLLVPLLGLLAVGAPDFLEKRREVSSLQDAERLTKLAALLGDSIHELQRERGVSSGALTEPGSWFRDELHQQRVVTDRRLQELRGFVDSASSMPLNDTQKVLIDQALQGLQEVGLLRAEIDTHAISSRDVVRRYTGVIGPMLDLVTGLFRHTTNGSINRTAYAYAELMRAKDYAGQERADLTAAFSESSLDDELLLRVIVLDARQKHHLDVFLRLGTERSINALETAIAGSSFEAIESFRSRIRDGATVEELNIDSRSWFEMSSRGIDGLRDVGIVMAGEMYELAATAHADARSAQRRIGLFVLGVCAITAAGGALWLRSIITPLTSVVGRMKNIAEGDADLSRRVDAARNDEFGELSRWFNAFVGKVETAHVIEQQSAERLRMIVAAARDAIIATDADGVVLLWGAAAESMFGWSAGEAVGEPLHELIVPPDSRRAHFELQERLRNSDESIERAVEVRLLHKDGREIMTELSISSFNHADDTGAIWIVRDVTERRRVARQRHVDEQRYHHIIDGLKNICFFYSHDTDGFMRYVSPSVESMLGYDPSAFTDHYADYLTDSPINAHTVEFTNAAIRGERQPPYKVEIRHKHGGHRIFELTEAPQFDEDGRVTAILGIARDVTEQERMTARMSQLAQAVEQSPAPVVITDATGLIEYVNPAFSQLTGHVAEEVLGRTTSILKSGAHAPEFYQRMWETISTGRIWSGRVIDRRKNGSLYHASLIIAPIRDAQGAVTSFVGLQRDVTAEVQYEHELSRTNTELADARRRARDDRVTDKGALPRLHPGGRLDHAPARRFRAGPRHQPQARRDDGRRCAAGSHQPRRRLSLHRRTAPDRSARRCAGADS